MGKFVLDGNCTVLPSKDDKHPHVIKLMVGNKPRLLAVENPVARHEWMKDLVAAIQKRREEV